MIDIYSNGLSRVGDGKPFALPRVRQMEMPPGPVGSIQARPRSANSGYVKAAREEQEISEAAEGPEFVLVRADPPRFRINTTRGGTWFSKLFVGDHRWEVVRNFVR